MNTYPPVMCNVCRTMAPAKEMIYTFNNKTSKEVRWVCPNCGSLVRCDEVMEDVKK